MANPTDTTSSRLTLALEAAEDLTRKRLREAIADGESVALVAHTEIQVRPVSQKCATFYHRLSPTHGRLIEILAESYRGYFKIALANPQETANEPEQWAWALLQPFVVEIVAGVRDWFMLACDGENQYVRPVASTVFVPGQTVSIDIPLTMPPSPPPESWRAPAWLFQVFPGVFRYLKSEHVPATDSEEKLGAAHTRLLLKGARRVLLSVLDAAIENARNEETAAAGAVPATSAQNETIARKRREPKPQPKGFEGLREKKYDYSEYTHTMTEKQHMAFSLRLEYGLPLGKVASRMGVDRKTAYEHIRAANVKVDQLHSAGKRKSNRAKRTLDD